MFGFEPAFVQQYKKGCLNMDRFTDNWKPAYHFRPEKNWMNDPNGPIYYEGEYHLFFQYNPYGSKWGTIHWGHAKSRDLIHWDMCPPALVPNQEQGEIHCYSGCAFLDCNVPTIYYTSVGAGSRGPEEGALQCAAVSRDGMQTWERRREPVLERSLHESKGVHIAMWRDPFVWQEEDGRYALLGGTLLEQEAEGMEEIRQGKGCLALYFAAQGKAWEFKNIIVCSEDYYLLECPNMIPYGEQYLLLYSPLDAVRYRIGTLDKESWTFRVQKEGILDYSIKKTGFYAPNTFLNDPKGRKIVIGWLSEADRDGLAYDPDWAGMQSIPRELWLEHGQVRIRPAQEAVLLRKNKVYFTHRGKETKGLLASGRALEICLWLVCEENACLELSVFASGDAREETGICWRREQGRIIIDRSISSLAEHSAAEAVEAYLEPAVCGKLQLRIYLDHSALEVFVNESIVLTARVYPVLEESCGVYLRSMENILLEKADIWELGL